MTEPTHLIRLGEPGHYAWEFTAPHIPSTTMVIVYADTTMQAIAIFGATFPDTERFEVRWMADGE